MIIAKIKSTIILSFLFFICFNNLYAHREKVYYLYGQIGGEEVAFQIDEYDTDCVATYMTLNDKYDHILEGKILENGQFNLFLKHWNSEAQKNIIDETITLFEKEKNQWIGTWKYKNGEEINFTLSSIKMEALSHPYLDIIKKYNISPYIAYRTQNIKFKKRKKKKLFKGSRIITYTELESEISFFRIRNSRKGILKVDRINDKLAANHINMINSKYTCVYTEDKGNYYCDFKIHFLNADFISYTSITHKACYTSKSKTFTKHHTFKLVDGEEPIIEDVFWFGEQPQPQLAMGEYKWMQYRYKVFGPKILELLTSLYPEKITPVQPLKCDYNNVKVWQFPIWNFTNEGLYLRNKLQDEEKCGENSWSVIPYEQLKEFTSKKYKFTK